MGLSLALLYIVGLIGLLFSGKESTVLFYNTLIPGIDVTPLFRADIPVWEMILGVAEMFVLGGIAGVLVAVIYNFTSK